MIKVLITLAAKPALCLRFALHDYICKKESMDNITFIKVNSKFNGGEYFLNPFQIAAIRRANNHDGAFIDYNGISLETATSFEGIRTKLSDVGITLPA